MRLEMVAGRMITLERERYGCQQGEYTAFNHAENAFAYLLVCQLVKKSRRMDQKQVCQ